MNWKQKLLFIPIFLFTLAGCNGGANNSSSSEVIDRSDVNALLPTPITDSFDFAQKDQLEGKKFAHKDGETSDHIGYVTLRSCTDGDTANFVEEGYEDETGSITIKLRFLGVNTPESTAKVEPWGKKASLFTKKVLTAAQEAADAASKRDKKKYYNIVLINDPTPNIFDERDSSGNRWLGFIWYRVNETAKWRLLNLELVEQAYSKNQLFADTAKCEYRTKFEAAEARNSAGKYRLYGESDPDYDYQEITYEYSLYYIIKHFDEIGITESGSSGFQLAVTALVVSVQGDNMFLRDVYHDQEQIENGDTQLAGLYAYAGYNSSIASLLKRASSMQELNDDGIGVVVRFYCRATIYSGNVQLSDVKSSTTGKKAFNVITASNFNKFKNDFNWSSEYATKGDDLSFDDMNRSTDTIRLEPTSISSIDDLAPYQYQFCDTEVKVRTVQPGEYDDDGQYSTSGDPYWYKGNTADNKSYTVYTTIVGTGGKEIYTNLRIDGSIYPFIEPAFFGTSNKTDATSENSPVGKTFHVTGYVAKYFDKYQIMLPNNFASMNYIYEVK